MQKRRGIYVLLFRVILLKLSCPNVSLLGSLGRIYVFWMKPVHLALTPLNVYIELHSYGYFQQVTHCIHNLRFYFIMYFTLYYDCFVLFQCLRSVSA